MVRRSAATIMPLILLWCVQLSQLPVANFTHLMQPGSSWPHPVYIIFMYGLFGACPYELPLLGFGWARVSFGGGKGHAHPHIRHVNRQTTASCLNCWQLMYTILGRTNGHLNWTCMISNHAHLHVIISSAGLWQLGWCTTMTRLGQETPKTTPSQDAHSQWKFDWPSEKSTNIATNTALLRLTAIKHTQWHQ